MKHLSFLAIALFAATAFAAETRTRLPMTYVLDAGPGRLSDADFVAKVALGPPMLQHMQCGSIVHSYFGDFDARNRAVRRAKGEAVPSPDYAQTYRDRTAHYKKLIASLRKAGCKVIVPYICIMTVGGDPDKRTGFWEFYDHWNELRDFGIGPKPPDDPELWNQRKPDGSPFHFYTKNHRAYRPMFRYSQCLNNPYWQQYIQWVVRMNAFAGYDGNFVDNANSHRCHCERCQRLFLDFLRAKYSANEMRALFRDAPKLDYASNELIGVETRRFYAETVKKFLAGIRKAGASVHGSWFVYPNGLHGWPRSAVTAFHDCDLAMDEYSVGEFGSHPGMVFEEVIAGIGVRHVNDDIFCYRHTLAANGRVRAALLTRAGYPHYNPAYAMNVDSAALGCAEAAAFSGGGAFMHRPATYAPELAAVRKTYNHFFTSHRSLYEGYVPYGQIALACFSEQQFYRDRRHIARAKLLLASLMQRHLLVDIFTERNWSAELLGHYHALIVPDIRYMADAEVATALRFAKQGKLLVTGDAAKCDLQMRERKADPFAAYRAPTEATALVKQLIADGLAVPVLEAKPKVELVRVAAFADERVKPTRLVLHLVDYNVPLGLKAKPAKPIADVNVSLPLPAGARVSRVTLSRPSEADATLAVNVADGAAKFTIPSIRIYGVCLVELAY